MIHVSDRLQVLLSNLASQALRILTALVLARLVTPKEYGHVELVVSFTALFASFGDFGLRRLLVQKRDGPEEQVRDTLCVLLYTAGLLLLIVNVACGVFLAWRHDNQAYFWLAASFGVNALLSAVHDAQLSIMSRRLAFSSEVKQQLILASALAISGVGFALSGFGVYTLALQPVVAQTIGNVSIQYFEPLRWPRHFSMSVAKSCLRPALQMALAYYFAVVVTPIQKLLIFQSTGRNLDLLGLFGRLLQLREMVVFNSVQAFERLIFPLLSVNQHDPARLRELFIRGCASVTTFVSFCGWGLAVTSPELVNVLAGKQWVAIQDPTWLPILGIPLMFSTGAGAVSIFLAGALNRTQWWTIHSFILVALSGIAGWLLRDQGATVLTIMFSCVQIIASLIVVTWAIHALQLNAMTLVRRLAVPVGVGMLTGGLVLIARREFLQVNPPIAQLLACGGLFVALYTMLTYLFDRETVAELRRLVRRRRPESVGE